MRAFTFTSKAAWPSLFLCILLLGSAKHARTEDRTTKPEEEDFSSTPYTEYGEFNEAEEEEAESKFHQYGRFFGISVGLGVEAVDGNRGALWQGGFPLFDFKVHYWFDFNFALDMGFFNASHFFKTTSSNGSLVDVNMLSVPINLKYYFDTKNLSAPISFANPFLLLGADYLTKTQVSESKATTETDSALGIAAGGGLEFVLKPRKVYLQMEGKIHLTKFKDTNTTKFSSEGHPDLTGNFYTISTNILFAW